MTSTNSHRKKRLPYFPQTVTTGIIVGSILSRTPVFKILSLTVRVGFSVLKPTLLVLGGAKAFELLQAKILEDSSSPKKVIKS